MANVKTKCSSTCYTSV